MITFSTQWLRGRIYACWLGKNIGGTLGAPYEGGRQLNDITGFKSKPGEPLPNDDLDLQLVWLRAMDELGPERVDAQALGEYWLSYITPHWNEELRRCRHSPTTTNRIIRRRIHILRTYRPMFKSTHRTDTSSI